MTIKDGIKFGIGFVIGKTLVGCVSHILSECLDERLKKLEESKQTDDKDVKVE